LSIVRLANLGVHSIKKAIRNKGGWEGFLPPLCLSAKRICQKLLVALSPSPTTASINLIRFLALTHPTPTLCLIYELYKLSLSACAVFYLLKRAGVRACEKFEVSPPHMCLRAQFALAAAVCGVLQQRQGLAPADTQSAPPTSLMANSTQITCNLPPQLILY
jgi:hypothetical protein